MKAILKKYGLALLRYLLTLCGIAVVIGLIVFFSTRPRIDGSILDSVVWDDGVYEFEDITRGMTEDEVKAYLDGRELLYFTSDDGTPYGQRLEDTWITLSDNQRITELGNVTIRRSYCFKYGELAYIDMETVAVKNRVKDDLARVEDLLAALEAEFGPGQNLYGGEFSDMGEVHYLWQGEDSTSILLLVHHYELEDWVKTSKNAAPTYTEHLDVTIRVTL